jgi:hypothetical protein
MAIWLSYLALFVTLKSANLLTHLNFNRQANGVVYERIQRFVIGLYYIHNGFYKKSNPIIDLDFNYCNF